ncbi:MAG: TatD family deoxyribonuclease [Desulfobacteraceae bacterium]|nr:MAG: TatD family deoxyribonuclease [Desulfobacteraceae bacterium]
MRLFDSHCHLDDRSYKKDLDAVIRRAHAAGVSRMMVVGTTRESAEAVVSLVESREDLYASVGFHPHDAKDCSEEALEAVSALALHRKVRAWGEIGLDFNRMHSSQEKQERWLFRQLEIAQDLNLPLIFHERDSRGRLVGILNDFFSVHSGKTASGVVHCFSGTEEELEQYLSMGFHIGITGIVTLKERGTVLRTLIPRIPPERLLVETDAPYLTPTPERNRVRRNEPAFVKSVLLKTAEVRGEDPEVLAAIVWENTCRLFRIDF